MINEGVEYSFCLRGISAELELAMQDHDFPSTRKDHDFPSTRKDHDFPSTRKDREKRRWLTRLSDLLQKAEASFVPTMSAYEDGFDEMDMDMEFPSVGTDGGIGSSGCDLWMDDLRLDPPPLSFHESMEHSVGAESANGEKRTGDSFDSSPSDSPSKKPKLDSTQTAYVSCFKVPETNADVDHVCCTWVEHGRPVCHSSTLQLCQGHGHTCT